MDDALYLHCLNLFPKFGPKKLVLLGNYFESFAKSFAAPTRELIAAGISEELARQFTEFRSTIDIHQEQDALQAAGIQLVSYQSESFPELLHEIAAPPALLYIRGVLPRKDAVMLAVVGTRKITTYGRSVMPRILEPLVDAGLVIVSGIAYGVDALAHRQSVEKHKPTVAVLGGGIDDSSFYPKQHLLFADEIIEAGGCILSEYPPGTPPLKQNFVARDRIISGLCVGTLIVECDLKSGSLITAQYALDQNRRVYAVPGPIYANESKGTNNLIKMGAGLVTEASDILQDLNIAPEQFTNTANHASTPTEAIILDILSSEPVPSDVLIKTTGLEAAEVTTALTFLEMKGQIKNVGAQQYIRVR